MTKKKTKSKDSYKVKSQNLAKIMAYISARFSQDMKAKTKK